MMKTLKNLMLVGLVAVSGILNAAQPPAPAPALAAPANNAPASTPGNSGNFVADGIYTGMVQLIAGGVILGTASYIKDYITGETANKAVKEAAEAYSRELSNNAAEIEIEAKKIAIAQAEFTGLSNQFNFDVLVFNGGNNTGLDKKDVQAQITKVWDAIKTNTSDSAKVIAAAKTKIAELEQKRDGIKAKYATPQTLAQVTQGPVETRQATPELAAKMLAASPARAA